MDGTNGARLVAVWVLLLFAGLFVGCHTQGVVAADRGTEVRSLRGTSPADPGRSETRRSLIYFGQLSDLHVADEMSPLRVEFIDASAVGSYAYGAAWRPQEAFSAQIADAAVRALNRRKISPTPGSGGSRSEMAFALVTGDLIDNHQWNELELVTAVLRGGQVDPFSGETVSGAARCPTASPSVIAELDRRVAAREYSGVQRYAMYPPRTPSDRYVTFWDPARLPPPSPTPAFPRYDLPLAPDVLDRAQQPFVAEGLGVPFFVARGNHGALVQGNAPAFLMDQLYHLDERGLGATDCRKVFPNATLDPAAYPLSAGALTPERQSDVVRELVALYGRTETSPELARFVPPDEGRVPASSLRFPQAFDAFPNRGGYAFVDPVERERSRGYAHYYAFSPSPGLRFVSLDTNPIGSGPAGSLSNPQFEWLARELATTPRSTLIVVFGHHSLATLDNRLPAPVCPPTAQDCLGDPRPWHPNHLGCPLVDDVMNCSAPVAEAPDNLRDLLLSVPNVVLYVSGHTHVNRITGHATPAGGGFWEITTASIIEWPQEARTLEIFENGDGTLSIFSTIVELGSAPTPSPTGDLAGFAQFVAGGDVEWRQTQGRDARGGPGDRNVELLMRDPR